MKRKYLFVGISLVAALGLFVGVRMAFAAGGAFGRPFYTGYLTGQPAVGVNWLFVPSANVNYDGLGPGCGSDICDHTPDLQSFLNVYHDRLMDTSSFVDRGRAAASIDVMLGQQGTSFCNDPPVGNPCVGTVQNGINYAVKNYQKWVDLVKLYASNTVPGYSVQWNANPDFTKFHRNAMGMDNAKSPDSKDCDNGQQCTGDITFIGDLNDPGHNHAVIFIAPGGFKFIIKHKCGNLTGDVSGLPVPTWKLSASSAPNETVPPGTSVRFVHTIRNSSNSDRASFDYNVWYKFPPSAVYKSRTKVTDVTLASGGSLQVKDPANNSLTIPADAQDGDKYCEYISFTNATGPNTASDSDAGSPACVKVAVLTMPSCNTTQPSIDPGNVDPHVKFTVTTTIDYPPNGAANAITKSENRMYVRVSGPTYSRGPISYTQNMASGNTLTHTFTNFGPTNETGTFTIDYGVKDSTGTVVVSCSYKFVIADEPYFSVTGGDVEAGAAMTVDGVCAGSGPGGPDDQAGVVGWNQENAAYDGAGAQYAAMALGYLQDFATAQGSTSATSPPSGLAFANTADVSSPFGSGEDTYGGGLDSEPCVPDYTTGLSGVLSGPQNAPAPSPTGHTTLYVNGDVFINSDVRIYNGGYNSLSAVPTYTVVAKGGNIYIAPGVTHLDGLYVAEPDGSGNGGNIYTCTTVPTQELRDSDSDNNLQLNLKKYYSNCSSQLTVNGSFVAKQVYLLRTNGTLYDNASGPAETFNFSPELWLATPNTSGAGSAVGADDSITSLPPVL